MQLWIFGSIADNSYFYTVYIVDLYRVQQLKLNHMYDIVNGI